MIRQDEQDDLHLVLSVLPAFVRCHIMKIECFLSESCGSYHQLRRNIEQALAELNTEADVSYPLVYYEEALRMGLKGSPAIRINGNDFDEGGSPGIA